MNIHDLETQGYNNFIEIRGRGICCLRMMAYTVGLFYGLDVVGYKGRYCYETMQEALEALKAWDGIDDPPGDWIKHFGNMSYPNPSSNKYHIGP